MLLVRTNHVVGRIIIITILRDGELPKMSVIPTVEDTSTGNGSKVNPQSIS